ncbi:MAG: preprotein translocase subunit SecG [Acidobacteria bacterium]|nr:preprotein translocase subunit SecG [Acidobacteriota bacterium]
MVYILYTLFFISCVLLIASVLLQPGKTDAGALFTSNISSTAFQPRGAQTVLSKITIGAATVFMLSALFLAMPALTGNVSVLQTTSDTPAAAEEEEAAAPSSTTSDANTSTMNNAANVVNANANTNITVESNTAVVVGANSAGKIKVAANTNNSNNGSK